MVNRDLINAHGARRRDDVRSNAAADFEPLDLVQIAICSDRRKLKNLIEEKYRFPSFPCRRKRGSFLLRSPAGLDIPNSILQSRLADLEFLREFFERSLVLDIERFCVE